MENGEFTIYNVEGRAVRKGHAVENEIRLRDLKDGIYFLKYETSRQIYTTSFVVQR
jgi:hypothetical protein